MDVNIITDQAIAAVAALQHDEEYPTLSAQHLVGMTARVDEDTWVFLISDGVQAIEVTHEFGSAEDAARRFDALATTAQQHAAAIRRRAGLPA